MNSKFRVTYLIVGTLGFVLLVFLITKNSGDLNPLILTEAEAVHVAAVYLAAKDTVIDESHVNTIFYRGNWSVMFFVNSSARPGSILIRVNPITGTAERIPLK